MCQPSESLISRAPVIRFSAPACLPTGRSLVHRKRTRPTLGMLTMPQRRCTRVMFRSRPCGMSTDITVRNRPLKFGASARPSQQFFHAWKYVLSTACAAWAGRTAKKSMSWRACRIAASAFG
jgi:hypothetical protein